MIPPGRGVFITGTDTGAGKTVAAAAVLLAMRTAGIDAVPMKPVQTGGIMREGELRSPDLEFCLRMAKLQPDPDELKDMAPLIYEPACSPHLAAAKTGRQISVERILQAFHRLLQRHERVVVEGAGGLLAPIDSDKTMIDLMSMLGLPVILAARPGIGAINHTLLSIGEIERSGLSLHGIIFCETTDAGWGEIEQNNVETIARIAKVRVLGRIPYMPEIAAMTAEFFGTLIHPLSPIRRICPITRSPQLPLSPQSSVARASLRNDSIKRPSAGPEAPRASLRNDSIKHPSAGPEAARASLPNNTTKLKPGAGPKAPRASLRNDSIKHPSAGPEVLSPPSSVWHPYTRHSALRDGFPLITRGEGVFLFDSEGNRYFDAISSWWACNLGHSHPRLVRAIVRQAAELQHSILGNLAHPRAVKLASRLVELFPGGRRRVLFASDGASAVEAALRVAVQYWHNMGEENRTRFVALEEAYHGDTIGAMAVGYLPAFHGAYRPLLFPVYKVKTPVCSGCPHGEGRGTCSLECFSSIERTVKEHANELAAVIVEPLCLGAAGMKIYPAQYLERLNGLCRENRILLIVDEIAMGFGRTGRMFAFEHAGIDPDIVCLGKGLSGGYLPISAAVVKEEIFDTFADEPEDHTFYHGHTFAGNPIASAAAMECLDVYREERIVEKAERSGKVLAAHFEAFKGLPGVENVRCLGMIAAFDLSEKEGIGGEDRARDLCRKALKKGVLIRPLGPTIYLMPPLITHNEVLAQTVRVIFEFVAR